MVTIDQFNMEIERGKYVTFGAYYVLNNKEETRNSINGTYEELRETLQSRKLRGSERLDITWEGLNNIQEVYDELYWYITRYGIINLKVCCDGYAHGISNNLKNAYNVIGNTIPKFKFKVPNGKWASPFEIIRLCRNVMAHDKDESDKQKRIELGISDVRKFLMTPCVLFDNGDDLKLISYDLNSSVIDAEIKKQGLWSSEYYKTNLGEILEIECCRAINAYDAIHLKKYMNETDCINDNFWIPPQFVQ